MMNSCRFTRTRWHTTTLLKRHKLRGVRVQTSHKITDSCRFIFAHPIAYHNASEKGTNQGHRSTNLTRDQFRVQDGIPRRFPYESVRVQTPHKITNSCRFNFAHLMVYYKASKEVHIEGRRWYILVCHAGRHCSSPLCFNTQNTSLYSRQN
jgi:hypothetical protein